MAVKREKVVQTAEKYVQRGKINAAIREYRKVLAEHPDDAMTLNRVGDLYARSDQIEEAIGLFTQIAQNYTADGFFPKATAIYKKIIKLDPTRLGVYEKLAELYHRQGLLNEARTQYQVLADYYVKHDNTTSATAIYERMTGVDPEDPSLRVRLAELYQQQKFLDKAMSQYQDIAELMLEHGHHDDAEAVLLKGLQIDSRDLDFIEEGVAKLRAADADGAAARFLARAVESNPAAAAIAERVGQEQAAQGGEEATAKPEASVAEEGAQAAAPAEEAVVLEGVDEAPALADADDEVDLVLDADADLDFDPELTGVGQAGAGDAASAADEADEPDAVQEAFDAEITLEMEALDFGEDLEESVAEPLEAPAEAFEEDLEPGPQPGPEPDLEAQLEPGLAETEAAAEADLPEADLPELEPPEAELEQSAGPAAVEESVAGLPPSLDHDFLERTAAELHPERIQQEEDLLTEAEVLVKYGLAEKATERLRELLALNAEHVGGRALLIRLHIDQGNMDTAAELATALAAHAGGTETWTDLWSQMEVGGFEMEAGGEILPPAGDRASGAADELAAAVESGFELTHSGVEDAEAADAAAVDDGVEEAAVEDAVSFDDLEADLAAPFFDVEDEDGDGAEAAVAEPEAAEAPDAATPPLDVEAAEAAAPPVEPPAASPPKRKRRRSVDDMLASLTDELLPRRRAKKAKPAAEAAPEPPPAEAAPAAGAGAEMSAEPVGAPPTASAPSPADAIPEPPPTAPPAGEAASVAATPEPAPEPEASPEWLEKTVSEAEPGDAGLFSDEDDFFDLAAELEEELSQEGALDEDDELLLETPREQSLEEIVEGFKKGVSENLSEEDHHTHFDLGIAYREMGLLDEAIGEFQVAAKSPDLLVECCSMLGLSFLEKGLPELAVKWYQRGLEVPGLEEEEQLGLLYDLGNVHMATGDTAQAHATFVDIYGTNSNYRDVVAKIEETRPR